MTETLTVRRIRMKAFMKDVGKSAGRSAVNVVVFAGMMALLDKAVDGVKKLKKRRDAKKAEKAKKLAWAAQR
jgi:hypothetical protein